ncbi:MAG: hypothetical protein BWK73_37805 [Thiothrix lacustris]|uniref:Arc-like DNA binding domain-containing protein n=1 Tax=Thiothrix lacustris TaxID=525917 RepID=A0A1Y1QEQ0_9GAMM|nr:MAG: hypothetical protein BWK73_37805 [Thiothrix lacustris]
MPQKRFILDYMEKITTSPFTVRLEPDLRRALEDSARKNGNSLQVEVANRLRQSLGMLTDNDERIRQIARETALELIREEFKQGRQLAASG